MSKIETKGETHKKSMSKVLANQNRGKHSSVRIARTVGIIELVDRSKATRNNHRFPISRQGVM